jgi:hypothetical protein
MAAHLTERKCRPSWRELAAIINAWLDQVSPVSSRRVFATPESLRMALLRFKRSGYSDVMENPWPKLQKAFPRLLEALFGGQMRGR